jgi:hypothetical protein
LHRWFLITYLNIDKTVEFWGNKKYSADSSICKAAFHSGALSKFGGDVIVEVDYGDLKYRGNE